MTRKLIEQTEMERSQEKNSVTVWRHSPSMWGASALLLVVLGYLCFDALDWMVKTWSTREEYSYGYLIPVITLFLIWQRKDVLEKIAFQGSWLGVVVVLVGVGLYFVGSISTLFVIVQYAFLIILLGLVLALTGGPGFRVVAVPLLFLAFMIPLPTFLLNNLSSKLQLLSSEFGVAVIRLFDISVYLEGNVIDLGTYKLQVVEACSGLNYLFPLMSLSFIVAYFFKAALWKRVLIFLSSMPITVLMNSFRIGAIGVLVEYWGVEQAEGFLHYFEGWVIFMACMAILLGEMWILSKIGKDKMPLREAFGLEFPEPTPEGAEIKSRRLPSSFVAAGVILLAGSVGAATLGERAELIPERLPFSEFPLVVRNWQGEQDNLEQIYIDALKFDDYFIGDFRDKNGDLVNFYAAYYGSQRAGESAHSPRACLPGGGWLIKDLSQRTIEGASISGKPLRVSRVEIVKGDARQLVYYWFQQRGRVITNEYLVKWFLLWDALTRNRTDGALVRLTAFVAPGQDIQEADRRLATFAQDVSRVLEPYIPN